MTITGAYCINNNHSGVLSAALRLFIVFIKMPVSVIIFTEDEYITQFMAFYLAYTIDFFEYYLYNIIYML